MLKNFVENPFENARMSNEAYALFMKNNLSLMAAANTTGQYTGMISALQPQYIAFQSWLGKQDKSQTNKKGKTQTVDTIIKNFKKFVSKDIFKEVNFKYDGKNQEKFNEFFPGGLSEYSKITKKTAEVLLDRIAKACLANKADLTAGLDTKAAEYNTTYLATRDTQMKGKGTVKDGSGEGETIRAKTAEIMYLNYLDQLKLHVKNREKALDLYDSAALNKKKSKRKDGN